MGNVKIIDSRTLSDREKGFYLSIEKELEVVMDVGAYPTFFVGEDVHYFEPHPKRYKLLEDSVVSGYLNNFGLGERKEIKTLYNGLNSVYRWDKHTDTTHPAFNNIDYEPYEIQLQTLDGYINRHGIDKISLLKVDVEGAEFDVFKGGKNVLNRCDYIVFEYAYNTSKSAGVHYEDISDLLQEKGFKLFTIEKDFSVKPIEESNINGRPDINKLHNIVAINLKNNG